MHKTTVLLLILATATFAFAAPRAYRVDSKLTINQKIESFVVMATPNKISTISALNGPNRSGFSMDVAVHPQKKKVVKLNCLVQKIDNKKTLILGEPSFLVELGKEAEIQVPASADRPAYSLAVKVTASR